MLEEFRARVAQSISDSKLSVRDIGEKVGKAPTWVSTIQNRGTDIGFTALFKLAEALSVNPVWLATGLGPKEPSVQPAREISQLEAAIVRRWQAIPDDAKGIMEQLEEWMAEPEPAVEVPVEVPVEAPVDELSERRAMKVLRLVGNVAAISPTDATIWDQRLPDEVEVPAEFAADDALAARVRGDSMDADDIHNGDLLIVTPAPVGRYQKGDRVLAWVEGKGMVVKIYGGQKSGIITLRSASDQGETLTGTVGDQVQVMAIVKHVWREE